MDRLTYKDTDGNVKIFKGCSIRLILNRLFKYENLEEKNQWHDAEKDVPDSDRQVLVANVFWDKTNYPELTFMTIANYDKEYGWIESWHSTRIKITHWRERPDYPKTK